MYLDDYYKELGVTDRFDKAVAAAGFIAYFFDVVAWHLIGIVMEETGNELDIMTSNVAYKEMVDFIAGDVSRETNYIVELLEDYSDFKCEPILDKKKFLRAVKNHLKSHKMPFEKFSDFGVTDDRWNRAVEDACRSLKWQGYE